MKWVILIVIILAAAGAGVYFFVLKQPAQEEQPKGPAQPVAEQPRELTDAEKQELATKKLDDLRRLARSNPDDVIGMKALRQQIEEFGDRATIMKAEAVFSTATSKYDDAAKKAYDKLSAEIKQKFQAELETGAEAPLIKKEKYERLLLLFDKFPAQYMSGEYAAMLSKLREPIEKSLEACDGYEKVRFEAVLLANGQNYEFAIAELNKFPERYRESEWEEKRQKLLAEYQSKLSIQQSEVKKEQALTYYDLYHGQSLDDSDFTGEGSWKIQDGVLIGESGVGSESVFAYSGGEDWVDLVLVLRMRLVRGSITVAVRGTEVAPQTLRYDPIALSTGELEPNKWYTLTIKLRGRDYTVAGDPPLRRVVESFGEKNRGPVAIWVKSNTELHIKSVKIGFFDKIPASFVNEATKQQEDGRAKKPGEEEKEEE